MSTQQGSVATRLRCGGMFNSHVIAAFSAECASERIVKIGEYLAKVWLKLKE